jgi:glycerophosphoryl diester phosphodiesterase
MVTEQFAKDTVSAGVGINTWTVNEESDIREMLSRNVNAIIGNYPDRVGEILKER